MEKIEIRETEDNLPTITNSIMKMSRNDRFFCLMPYYHVWKQLPLHEDTQICFLDIGCGDGLFLRVLANTNHVTKEKFTYVGIDISLRKLRMAQNQAKKIKNIETHLLLADAEHMPFKDKIFQIGTAIEVMEHLLEPKAFFSELYRVSMVCSKIFITTPSAFGTKGHIFTFLSRFFFMSKALSSKREEFIVVDGKKLPHRDFTMDEVDAILLPQFNIISFYSFNFGVFHHGLSKILPYKTLVRITIILENKASILPKNWGGNWLIYAQKAEDALNEA